MPYLGTQKIHHTSNKTAKIENHITVMHLMYKFHYLHNTKNWLISICQTHSYAICITKSGNYQAWNFEIDYFFRSFYRSIPDLMSTLCSGRLDVMWFGHYVNMYRAMLGKAKIKLTGLCLHATSLCDTLALCIMCTETGAYCSCILFAQLCLLRPVVTSRFFFLHLYGLRRLNK